MYKLQRGRGIYLLCLGLGLSHSLCHEPAPTETTSLENGQRVRRTSYRSWHIQWTTCQQEAISLLLFASLRQSLQIPQFADVQAEQTQEILMKHYNRLAFCISTVITK